MTGPTSSGVSRASRRPPRRRRSGVRGGTDSLALPRHPGQSPEFRDIAGLVIELITLRMSKISVQTTQAIRSMASFAGIAIRDQSGQGLESLRRCAVSQLVLDDLHQGATQTRIVGLTHRDTPRSFHPPKNAPPRDRPTTSLTELYAARREGDFSVAGRVDGVEPARQAAGVRHLAP